MKVLNEFTLKNLKLNKSRTIVMIVGIMLSCALITVVLGMAFSAKKTLVNSAINVSGNYDLCVEGASTVVYKNARANRNVENIYIRRNLGCAYMPQARLESKPYINVVGFNKKAYTDGFNVSLAEGRLPKNENEIVLSKSILEYSKADYKVGDTLTLDLGKRMDLSYPDMAIEDSAYYFDEDSETLINTHKQTYKIVGIFNDITSTDVAANVVSGSCSAFTLVNVYSDNDDLFIKFTQDGEKNYFNTSTQILNYSSDDVKKLDSKEIFFEGNDFDFSYINYDLLKYRGFTLAAPYMLMILIVVIIILSIIIIASIFVIRNSFAISINEKTKLYGMLASIGATSKQIRHNVMYEGFVLGAIGIPFGLILGIGVISLLVMILNNLMGDLLNGTDFVYSVPCWCVLASIALTAIIIFFSTLSSAIRASKIDPITAIRNNNNVKLDKKRPKSYKSPKFIKKVFGVGGEIAYKNLKRSKKKYRTTIISIIVTVAMFISASSFVDYGMNLVNSRTEGLPYNIIVSKYTSDGYNEAANEYKKISNAEGIESVVKCYSNSFAYAENISNYCTDEAKAYYSKSENLDGLGIDDLNVVDIVAVDDKNYKSYVESLGYNYDDVKDNALVLNTFSYYDDNGVLESSPKYNFPSNLNIKLYPDGKYEYTEEELKEILKYDPDFVVDNKCVDIKIVGTIDKKIENSLASYYINNEYLNTVLLVNESTFEKLTDHTYMNVLINSSDATKTVEAIKKLDISHLDCKNYVESANQQKAILLIFEIFAYGFIVVISLIGITNVFNTINTNMKLRSKEFAMLKSIGMTKNEFNRMIRLESLFYGLKSLVVGIPLGLLGGYAIYKVVNSFITINYSFPIMAVLISIVFVFSIIWLIMRVSISNVNKQNIIETIRNDNI